MRTLGCGARHRPQSVATDSNQLVCGAKQTEPTGLRPKQIGLERYQWVCSRGLIGLGDRPLVGYGQQKRAASRPAPASEGAEVPLELLGTTLTMLGPLCKPSLCCAHHTEVRTSTQRLNPVSTEEARF